MMQTDVKSATVTSEGSAYAGRARVKALSFVTTGTAGSVQIEDGDGGAVKLNIATAGVADTQYVLVPGEGVLFETGIWVVPANVTSVTVFYG
jgi:hypothetical protein